jgi:hypothetical protein
MQTSRFYNHPNKNSFSKIFEGTLNLGLTLNFETCTAQANVQLLAFENLTVSNFVSVV